MSEAVDRAGLLERVEGDTELLADMVGMLKEDCPPLLAALRDGLARGDAAAVAAASHTLKGMVANFCADPAAEAARRLEEMGRGGDLGGGPAALAAMEAEARRLEEALDAILQGN